MDFDNDMQIKAIKYIDKPFFAKEKTIKGLFLHIKPTSKLWILQYTSPTAQKQRRIGLGAYPLVSLANARKKALECYDMIANGTDPLEYKKTQRDIQTKKNAENKTAQKEQIHLVVNEWIENIYSQKVSDITLKKESGRIYNHILKPFSKCDEVGNIISSKPISKIKETEIIGILQEISKTKSETSERLFYHCKRIFGYARSRGYIKHNFISDVIKGDTLAPPKTKHIPKITDKPTLKELFISIDNYKVNLIARQLLKLICHIPLRANNILTLKWDYIDFDKRVLTIPRKLMKVKDTSLPNFRIPLTSQAIDILQETKAILGVNKYVYPSRDFQSHISHTTINNALANMGFDREPKKQTTHSFRGTFRSLAETYGHIHNATREAKEAVIDHIEKNQSTLAYIHQADYTEQMKPLLEWWSDFIDDLKKG